MRLLFRRGEEAADEIDKSSDDEDDSSPDDDDDDDDEDDVDTEPDSDDDKSCSSSRSLAPADFFGRPLADLSFFDLDVDVTRLSPAAAILLFTSRFILSFIMGRIVVVYFVFLFRSFYISQVNS